MATTNLSTQSIVVAVVYVIFAFFILALSIKWGAWGIGLILVIIYLLWTALTVYDTNCLTKGSCNIWSWIRSILLILTPIATIIGMFYAYVSSRKEEKK
jgi:hypothetical protein